MITIPQTLDEELTADRGFVLIGVVMFVLALTILGLSLFALSSYEAQFAGRAYDSERALNVAQSGLDHAKFALARKRTLQGAHFPTVPGSPEFPAGLEYVRARRMDGVAPDTIANLDQIPSDVPVEIRVLANVNGERRMLQANFLPQQGVPIYKRLLSITDRLLVRDSTDSKQPTACAHSWFEGEVMQGGDPACGNYPPGSPVISNDLPQPDVATFFSQHLAAATLLTPSIPASPPSGSNIAISLVGSSPAGQASYFKTITDPNGKPYSLYIPRILGDNGQCTITVSGWVVWMLPRGFRSINKVVIEGTGLPDVNGLPHDCLVIVAGPSSDLVSTEIGIPGLWFDNTIENHDNIPVILVTSGWFGYEHSYAAFYSLGETLNHLTVFARSALFGAGDGQMTLKHLAGDPNDDPNGLVDRLCEQGALPNSQAGGIRFKSVAGSWKELDPDNP